MNDDFIAQDTRLQINNFLDPQEPKITANFMENELMKLQQKISGLEQKLKTGGSGATQKANRMNNDLNPNSFPSQEQNSRLEINLSKHENDVTGRSEKESLDSHRDKSFESSKKIQKSNRRSESVAVRTSKTNFSKYEKAMSSSKKLNSGTKSIRSRHSTSRSNIMEPVKSNLKSSRITESGTKGKSYMRQTNSSVKKMRKNNNLQNKLANESTMRVGQSLRGLAHHP